MHSALILSAGRGERLKPLTNKYPKALCEVHGIPVIEHHIVKLAKAGFSQIIINHAYLGGKIRRHLGLGSQFGVTIHYLPEPPGALETAGAIINALPLFNNEAFLTINADIFTDYDFRLLNKPNSQAAHLVLVNKPCHREQGDFGLDANHLINNHDKHYVFAGIAKYHPDFFIDCKPGRYSITPLLRAKADAQQVSGELHSGRWIDIGSYEQLNLANRH